MLTTNNPSKVKITKHKLIALGLLVILSPFVVYDFKLSKLTYPILWIGIPLFLYSLLPKKKPRILSVFVVLLGIVFFLNTAFSFLGFVFCGYSKSNFNYISTKNRNIKLVGRDYSCYGTTGDLVLYKEFSISKAIKIEVFYKKFRDYKNINIDTAIWKRIEGF